MMFLRCSSQWRMSFSGPSGLDYPAVFQIADLYGISDKKEMFEALRTMESAALSKMHESK